MNIRNVLVDMTNRVLENIAVKYQKSIKGVKDAMSGQMKNLHFTAEQAMSALGIAEAEHAKYAGKLL